MAKIGREASKELDKADDNPFVLRKLVAVLTHKLEVLGASSLAPSELSPKLEDECLRLRAEFWDRFSYACNAKGWELTGSTSRRLVSSGIFIEFDDDEVEIVELGIVLPPFVPSVIQALEEEVELIRRLRQEPQKFIDLLGQAYAHVPGEQERPIEQVYRAAVLAYQKPSFWRTVAPSGFARLSRPAFRSGLAEVMASGLRTSDGRELRFGTSLSPKETWEVFSPGEGRVVQVGRIGFVPTEGFR
ncbi:hypothetical protein [Archangium sp.]|uniref:hypothetical protein n=1 Tax=Archangium sp. TaxID=1872627 RepID=UPI00389A3BA6